MGMGGASPMGGFPMGKEERTHTDLSITVRGNEVPVTNTAQFLGHVTKLI